MSKLAFNKLGLVKNTNISTINYNGQEIEIKQYLPVNDKLALIANVINNSGDDNNFANPMKISVYAVLEIIGTYTNISWTEKQKEDPCKLYDLLVANGLSSLILNAIPAAELNEVLTGIEDTVDSFYKYRNSIFGILEAITQDYNDVNFDMTKIQEMLQDGNSVGLLKEIMPLINSSNEG